MNKTLLRIIKIAALMMGALLILLCLALAGVLGTQSGRQAVLNFASSATASENFQLKADNLTLGREWGLGSLQLSDAQGVWLELSQVRLQLRLGQLFLGRVHLDHFGIAHTILHRLPASEEKVDETTTSAPSIPPVRVTALNLDRIELRQAALGQEAELSVHGELDLNQDGGQANLAIVRLDRPEDTLRMAGRFQNAAKQLSLDVQAHEAPDGLLHTLLDLNRLSGGNATQGVTLSAQGQGSLSDWPLMLSLRLAGALSFDANATLKLSQEFAGTLHSRLHLGTTLQNMAQLADPNIDLSARASWAQNELQLTHLQVENSAATINGNATWNQAQEELQARLKATVGNISALLPPDIAPGPAELEATLLATAKNLRLDTGLTARKWTINGQRLDTADLNASLMRAADDEWNFHTSFTAHAPDLPSNLQTLTGSATGKGRGQSWLLDNLAVDSQAVSLRAQGKLDSTLDTKASLEIRRLALGPDHTLSGSLDASVAGNLDLNASTFLGRIALGARKLSGLPPEIIQLVGTDPKLRATVTASPDQLHVKSLELLGNTQLTANGTFSPKTQAFTGAMNAVFPELNAAQLRLGSGAAIRGQAHGDAATLDLGLEVRVPMLSTGQVSLTNATATLGVSNPRQPVCDLRAQALLDGEPAELRLQAVVDNPNVLLQNATLHLPHNTLALSGKFNMTTQIFQGNSHFDSANLAPLGRLAGQQISGKLALQADFLEEKGQQVIRAKGSASALSAAGAHIENVALQGNLALPDPAQHMQMELKLEDIRHGETRLDNLHMQAQSKDKGIQLNFGLDQKATQSALKGKGHIAWDASQLQAALSDLRGTLLGQKLQLSAPVNVTSGPKHTSWTQGILRFGQASLSSSGAITPEAIDITARLENMNPALLRLLQPDLPQADIGAHLTVRGTPTNPDARLEVQAKKIKLTAIDQKNLPTMDISGRVALSADQLESTLTLTGERGVLATNATFSLPVQATISSLDIPENAPVTGRMQGSLELALLPHLLLLDDQALTGKTELDFLLGGTVSAPALNGSAHIRSGRYENYRTGTRFEAISATATAQDTKIRFDLNATDGAQGTLNAQGTADLRPVSYACDIRLNKCQLVNMDLARSTIGGNLHIQGSTDAAAVNGTLVPDPTYVYLPHDTSGVTHIEVEEVNVPGDSAQVRREKSAGMPVKLNLKVNVPARLFVRGRGLDSEWSGRLNITTDARSNPVVRGQMNLLRGHFEFLDRMFNLTKGVISLDGENPPNPFLDIQGEVRVMDTQILVHIDGPAKNFRLALSSVPPLPKDELLSMVLFGRTLRQISPLQAVRLAQAAAALTGVSGAGMGAFDSLKASLGLQEVDVGEDDAGNTAVGVGGYVGGKYYVRTQSSVSGQDRTKIEIQLTPKISVDTEIGADSRQGGGINWSRDY